MVLCIVGSRKLNFEQVEEYIVKTIEDTKPNLIISGGASGADTHAKKIAKRLNINFKEYKADWQNDTKLAGLQRNTILAEQADVILCLFLHRIEGGTKDTLKKSRAMNKKTIVYIIDEIELNLF